MNSNKTSNSSIKVNALPAFSDNYIWAISNDHTIALVDPGDADVCIDFIEKNQLTLNAILITHHHLDHTGGIQKLVDYCSKNQWPLKVYGPKKENIPCCNIQLEHKDVVNLPLLNINLDVIGLPGHTLGHIAYFVDDNIEPRLFCGDTLFSGGCGRLFEGTAKQMLNSLSKLTDLPDNTKVYCAHEYTQANLKFSLSVEPNNEALIKYSQKVTELRAKNQATIPTLIKVEKQINPFLRSHIEAVQLSAIGFDSNTKPNSLDTFTTIRRWKDQF
jgi:hydroxyacylglutathione hydrolase